MSGKVYPLHGSQRDAVDPRECVWLSASAGTGKTQVLSARVLRLLLQPDTDPSQILCLTFTKAGAAEMAVRVNDVLARWVRMDAASLAGELKDIGAPFDPDTQARARTLFASVLDTPGGGLRIDTIHAFAQWLLATFPEEAEIAPGSRPMEDRKRELLSREVLADMLVAAERDADAATLDAIARLSCDKGVDGVRGWLMRCAGANDLWTGPGAWQPPMRPRVNRLLGLAADASPADATVLCADDAFDVAALRDCLAHYREWKGKQGAAAVEAIGEWLAAPAADRAAEIDRLADALFFKNGNPRLPKSTDAAFAEASARAGESIARVREFIGLVDLAEAIAPQLELGRKFALLWEEAKAREGLVDFDDQIRRAANLLGRSDMAAWIRYKLDRRFDHVLIDEAQDTNAAQWAIVFALIDDFFAGEGAHDDKLRTIFTVGDYKQAIFRFQGTSPENFEAARARVKAAMDAAAQGASESRADMPIRELREYGLDESFRTGKPVLDFVDRAIDAIGHPELGLTTPADPHVSRFDAGLVTLWQPVSGVMEREDEEGEEGWLARHDRQMADRIARQVRAWLDNGFTLAKSDPPRNAGPGDIMVLVRKRKELAGLIVARLHAAGVPVAGVDRLRLGAPLGVKDLMAALRFAAQPLDDLNLANLLVSPLGGWSQEDLLAHAHRPRGMRLWAHLRSSGDPLVVRTREALGALLARADYELPQSLLRWILVGPWQGRRKLVARLGREANDPIDELLNAAHAYAAAHPASLQGFIRWFDAGDGELKREAGEGGDLVRVMTAHGSKGLQAPIVILADATGTPPGGGALTLDEPVPGEAASRTVPMPALSKDQRLGPVAAAHEAALAEEMREHWRLLYVAMTRAEEALFIGGSLGPREKGEPHPDSWYARLAPLFEGDGLADDLWGARWEIGSPGAKIPANAGQVPASKREIPDWAALPVGPEPRPPRPLAPSAAGEDSGAEPPLPPDRLREAALRGTLTHKLLERLPDVAEDKREALGRDWLERHGQGLPKQSRGEILTAALRVMADPAFSHVFGPSALAEVPLAAIVDGQVVAGTVDRLLVEPERVTVVDFKTARRPPQSLEQVPRSTLRQMGAYAAALERIYPGRTIDAAVLYTQTPRLIAIPRPVLAAQKAALSVAQESFDPSTVEPIEPAPK
ncbi:double-strand break repair helicase AddA [Pelagerythrobacter marensis]|uniref:DNA 3'-5' helicase n=1 Tax=Pelagerythrobacter marensis TaxID=543877 RepID=A0A0G3X6I8_9SPHN|nr:double-strand break repair helicase AddA [Pelagerythrobacter marensis]AKM07150.1 ATP-dependent exoDNAse beta subunit [Pelagerythrobacter marensis]